LGVGAVLLRVGSLFTLPPLHFVEASDAEGERTFMSL